MKTLTAEQIHAISGARGLSTCVRLSAAAMGYSAGICSMSLFKAPDLDKIGIDIPNGAYELVEKFAATTKLLPPIFFGVQGAIVGLNLADKVLTDMELDQY